MRICYHAFFTHDELGELDAFFEKKGRTLALVSSWDANDAEFRPEYMARLFRHFGVDMQALPKKDFPAALKLLRRPE